MDNLHTEEEQTKSIKLSALHSHNHSQRVGHHTPPQHPTTKETEAANVLMNLSGKAAAGDRLGQAGLDSGVTCISPPAHVLQLSSRDLSTSKDQNRFVTYTCPESLLVSNSISCGTAYSSASLTYLASDLPTLKPAVYSWADEVPQINEEDLLPLATEVVCNVCEQQCKDVVELHEHLLAAHNTPDHAHDTLPASKKPKILPEGNDTSEYSDISRIILQESGGNKLVAKERKSKRKSRSKRTEDMSCNISDKVSVSSSENCGRRYELLDGENLTTTTPPQAGDDSNLKGPSTYILPSSTPGICVMTAKSVMNNQYIFSPPTRGTANNRDAHACISPYSPESNPTLIESCVEGDQQTFSPASRATSSTDSLHTCILPRSPSGSPVVVIESDALGVKDQDLLQYRSDSIATEGVVPAADGDLLPSTGGSLAAGPDALAIAVEKSQIESKEGKVLILVCIDCSSGFTESEEASRHACLPDQALIKRQPDCSVTLSDHHPLSKISQDHVDHELHFPEFVIRRIKGQAEMKDHVIVHRESGCTLQLHTPYQPDDMKHQPISFRSVSMVNTTPSIPVHQRNSIEVAEFGRNDLSCS